jgi:hypothetical protein
VFNTRPIIRPVKLHASCGWPGTANPLSMATPLSVDIIYMFIIKIRIRVQGRRYSIGRPHATPQFAPCLLLLFSAETRCFVEEPDATFSLVDPHFDQALGGHIAILVA